MWFLHLFFDFGTAYLAVAYQITHNDEKLDPKRTVTLRLDREGKLKELPQIIGWNSITGELLYGKDVSRDDLDDPDIFIFTDFKQFMLTKCVTKEFESRLDRIPGKAQQFRRILIRYLEQLYTDSLERAFKRCRQAREDFIIRPYFAMPEIATPCDTRDLSLWLKEAGWPASTCIVSESDAAGAWHAYDFKQALTRGENPCTWQTGSAMIVVDSGGTTTNIVKYHMVEHAGEWLFRLSGHKRCINIGSQSLTKKCLEAVRDQCEEAQNLPFATILQQLGLTSDNFDRKVAQNFESFKRSYVDEEGGRLIRVHGRRGNLLAQVFATIRSIDMESWITEHITQIRSAIDEVCCPDVKVMALCGGYFNNMSLVGAVKAAYESQDIYVSICTDGKPGDSDKAVVMGIAARFQTAPGNTLSTGALGYQ